ncbi:hypothetical protein [Lacinutrix mariniflava]|uniref:hypothetical protein n=1 Tax=Lacinutrix mariniflava TaxID=342955 RepID=UPI0006E272EB|nr:hypothetical protein [Lacinutrix mariniflava]
MKNLKNLGQALTKAEQKTINGGRKHCNSHNQCASNECCKGLERDPRNGYCGVPNNGDPNNCQVSLEPIRNTLN